MVAASESSPRKNSTPPDRTGQTVPGRDARLVSEALTVRGNEHFGKGLLYRRVPKDPLENIAYRRKWREYGQSSPERAADVVFLCKKDPLWYINTFVWTLDSRKHPSKLPFITYPYQDDAILDIVNLIKTVQASRPKRRDERCIEKSRDMGATWVILAALDWYWRFFSDMKFLLLSRKEEEVDDSAEDKALFQKLDFINKHMPGYLMPPIQRLAMRLKNLENGSSFVGESTNKNAGRSNRVTAIVLDEFAAVENGAEINKATAHVTYCRIFNSTVQGNHTEFSRIRKSGIQKIRMHWSQHPEKNKGLYTSVVGALEQFHLRVLDGDEIPGYPYILDGKVRSPWYDAECLLLPPDVIAQELDIDDAASLRQFFDAGMVDRLLFSSARPAIRAGFVEYDQERCRVRSKPLRDDEEGDLKLWTILGNDNKPDRLHRYGLFADVSAGTGASNSTLVVGDFVTRTKVAELATSKMKPERFARLCMAVGFWFNGLDGPAELMFENNGPTGRMFGDTVLELGYPRLYIRPFKGEFKPEYAGWNSDTNARAAALANLRDALYSGNYSEPSKTCLEEMPHYVYNGPDIVHTGSMQKDPSGAKKNHGDRVIATMMMWMRIGGPAPQTSEDADTEPAEGTFGHRQRESLVNQEEFW